MAGFIERIYFAPRADPGKRRAFEALLADKHCAEIGSFLSAVAEYKRRKPSREAAKKIFDRFIGGDETGSVFEDAASDTINLSAHQVDVIRTRLLAPDEFIFDEAVDEMDKLVRANGFVLEFTNLERAVAEQRAASVAKGLAVALLVATAAIVCYLLAQSQS